MSRYRTQEVCPWNGPKFVQITRERGFRPGWRETQGASKASAELPDTQSPSLVALMRMTREEWDVWTRGSAIRRAGYAGLRRNVAVALGNWLSREPEPPEEALAALRDAVTDEDPLVREHATWALAQTGRMRTAGAPDAT